MRCNGTLEGTELGRRMGAHGGRRQEDDDDEENVAGVANGLLDLDDRQIFGGGEPWRLDLPFQLVLPLRAQQQPNVERPYSYNADAMLQAWKDTVYMAGETRNRDLSRPKIQSASEPHTTVEINLLFHRGGEQTSLNNTMVRFFRKFPSLWC